MSSNKRKKMQLRSDTQIRSSFDERVCDDLSEVLLQYLPFEDKFRFESVSKQFQRTLFNRQFELTMDYGLKTKLKTLNSNRKEFGFNLSAFESILKKCPNIRTISLMNLYYSSSKKSFRVEYNKIIDLIIRLSHNLSEFECYVNKMNRKTIELFAKSFGPKLISLRFLHSDEKFDKNLLKSMVNIRNVSLNSYMPFSLVNIFDGQQCLVRNLRKLALNYDSHDIELFHLFAEQNSSLEILDINSYTTDQNSLNQLLTEISNFSNLKELNIITDFEITNNLIAKTIKQMANKCQKLKKIHFNLFVDIENHSQVLEIIDSLKHFKSLQRIHLSLDSDFVLDLPEDQILISCQSLSACKQLTDLSIYSNEINDSFFKDIGIYLPDLKCLHILNANITDVTLNELSQLKKVNKLVFYQKYSMKRLNQYIIDDMYYKCPKLKSIKFRP